MTAELTSRLVRSSRSVVLVAMVVTALSVSSCAVGSGAQAIRPDEPTAANALGTPGSQGRRPRLLVVDWAPESRGDLEVAMKQGVAVVALRAESVQLLPDCQLEGDYGFIGIVRKERVVQLRDGDEIKANLPIGGASLSVELAGELSRGASLEVGLVMVGKRMTTRRKASAAELEGDCQGATHFVRGATVGAFAMAVGTAAKVRSAVELFGVGLSAGSGSEKQVRTSEGVLKDCLSADPDGASPPKQCGSPLWIDLAPIAEGSAATAGSEIDVAASPDLIASECPGDLVMQSGKCTSPVRGQGYQCRGIDPVECGAQCDLGHGGSCLNLGWAYERGIGVDKDEKRAFELYAKSCDLETTEGCRALAFMYVNGLGVRADPAKALGYYESACKAGDALGCSNLGVMYAHGSGVAADIHKAVELYRRACNGGSARGCINLGTVYEEGSGVGKDPIAAAKLYKRACLGDHPAGCVALGHLYDEGIGLARDTSNARTLYERGCRGGDLEICVELGIRYDKGDRAPADPKRAAELFAKACEGAFMRGCANLGLAYRHGRGVAQDWTKAAELFDRACAEGVACASLGELYGLGKGVPKDRARAKELLAGPCREGDGWACDVIRLLKL